jgi:hypothetical protein
MSRSVDNDLAVVRGVSINFLIASHARVETDFPATGSFFTDGLPFYKEAVC